MTLNRPLHFHCVPDSHDHLSMVKAFANRCPSAQTYDDAPMWCLINHWLTKYTRRLRTFRVVVFWAAVIPFYSKTPTLRRCIPFVDQCRTLKLLVALVLPRTFAQPLFPQI